MRFLRLLAVSFILAAFLVAGLGAAAYWVYRDAEGPGPLAENKTVVIPAHSGVSGAADVLAQQGVIRHPLAFEAIARLSARGGALKAGEYEFPAGASTMQALEIVASGKTVKHRLTIPEGLTSAEVIALVKAAPALDGDPGQPPPTGDLLPDTYVYSYGDTRKELVERMQKGMVQAIAHAWGERRPDTPLTDPREAVTLASIVEKETAREEERPHVAGVYVNRLRLGMKLQADPTVLFAVTGEGASKPDHPLTRADLAMNSRYNTYVVKGLPPGPIANPGRSALRAAVRPERTEDLYFVADGSGGHIFAKTLADQNRNVAQYRRAAAAESDAAALPMPDPEPPPAAAAPIPTPAPAPQAAHVKHCRPEPGHPCPR